MKNLLAGIEHFQKFVFPSEEKLFQKLASGQSPQVLLVTCSDSRIDAELITQVKPGEIFHVRNAGNIVPRHDAHQGAEAGAIEYAVEALGIRNVIVCGHSDCGAMKGLLNPSGLSSLPSVASWVRHAAPALSALPPSQRDLDSLIASNVLHQIENLKTHPAIARRLEEMNFYAWIYRIEAGQVLNYDPASGRFVPVLEVFAAVKSETAAA